MSCKTTVTCLPNGRETSKNWHVPQVKGIGTLSQPLQGTPLHGIGENTHIMRCEVYYKWKDIEQKMSWYIIKSSE
jgi:hypothetical protein